jgi:hypothetical protein
MENNTVELSSDEIDEAYKVLPLQKNEFSIEELVNCFLVGKFFF